MNNDVSNKIKCILEEGKRYKQRCCIVGPTGPRGPIGPATISVGDTVTGDPGTEASVTNTGTNENVILTFTIPQGPTGPQGPSGTSVNSVYGRKYDTTSNNISLTQNIVTTVPLSSTGPLLGITGDNTNTLTIPSNGVYKIDYFFQGSTSVETTLTMEVLRNNVLIDSSSIDRETSVDVDETFYGNIITELSENDEISLGLDSTEDAEVSPSLYTNAYLNIVKLS